MSKQRLGLVFFWVLASLGCEGERRPPHGGTGPVHDPANPSGPGRDLTSEVPEGPDAGWDGTLPHTPFAAPEGVAVARDHVIVANSAYRFSDGGIVFDEGFVTVVRLSDFQVVNRLRMPARNPQVVLAQEQGVLVLCSGETTWDHSTGVVRPVSDGALVVLDPLTLETAAPPTLVIPLPRAGSGSLVGYPSSMAITSDGRYVYVGSGTSPAVFKVDLLVGEVLRGPLDPIAFGDLTVQDTLTVEKGPAGTLFVGSFNRDLVFALDTDSDTLATVPFQQVNVGKTGDMDGVLDLVYRVGGAPDLFVLLGTASTVQAMTTSQGAASLRTLTKTGLYPNRIALWGDTLLILNSGENNVTAFDIPTRKDLGAVAVFPEGTNPYDMAITMRDGRPMLLVTGLLANTLYEVDLQAKKVTRHVR